MRSFFLPFSFFLCGHLTSCIRDSRSFARRFAPSNDVRCGTSSILLSPTKKKTSCDLLHGVFFSCLFPFFLQSYNLLHPRSRSFVPRFASSKCVRCGTSSILSSPTKRKHHVIRAVGFFIAFSLFSHLSFPPALKNLLHLTPQRGIIRKHMGH